VPSRRRPTDRDHSDSSWRDPLFPFPSTDDDFTSMLRRWIALSSRHRRLLGLVFGLIEAPPFFSEMRFEMTCQAVELLGRRVGGVESLATFSTSMSEALTAMGAASLADEVTRVRAELWEREAPFGMRL